MRARGYSFVSGLVLWVVALAAEADPCQAQRQPLEGKWGYARRGAICEGLIIRPRPADTRTREWELISLMPWGMANWPTPGTRYRLAWPKVDGPVTVEARGNSRILQSAYRLDAIIQGPYLEWSTDVMRAAAVSRMDILAKTMEQVGKTTEPVYLPVVLTNLDDDDEPLPPPTRYLLDIGTPVVALRDLAFTVTRLTPAGTPAGPSQPVMDVRQRLTDRPMSGVSCPLDLASIPLAGLYRVQLTATNPTTQQPINASFLIRKS